MIEQSVHRKKILEAAKHLFFQYGLRAVSMDDIANKAAMSKKTIYQEFKDKDELIADIVREAIAENKRECIDEACGQAKDAIHEVVLHLEHLETMHSTMNPSLVFELKKYHAQVYEVIARYKSEELYKSVHDNIKLGQAQGLYRAELDADLFAKYRIESLFLLYEFKAPTQIVQAQQQILIHFLFGLVTEKGYAVAHNYLQEFLRKQNK